MLLKPDKIKASLYVTFSCVDAYILVSDGFWFKTEIHHFLTCDLGQAI